MKKILIMVEENIVNVGFDSLKEKFPDSESIPHLNEG
jgi:hypothetical protein